MRFKIEVCESFSIMTRSNDKKHIRVNVCKSKFVAHNITNAFALVLQIFGKALCINGRIKMNGAIDGQLIYKDLSTVNMFRKFFSITVLYF